MSKKQAIKHAKTNATKYGFNYAVVPSDYLGGWWVVTLATAKANGLQPVYTTEAK
jgi:hypothetical protein